MGNFLYAGVDVSSEELVVAFLNAKAKPLRPQASFPNQPEGWSALADSLIACANLCGPKTTIVCGIESTGDHHQGLLHTLQNERRRHIQVHELNPYAVRHFAKALMISAKTDRLDAHTIALYLLRLKPEPSYQPPLHVERLKRLTRFRRFLVEDRTALKNRLHHLLRLYFPGYQEIANGRLPTGLLASLAHFPSPHLILEAGEEGLREIRLGPKHRPRPIHIKRLIACAKKAPFKELSSGEALMIRHLASQILEKNQIISAIDREIEAFLREHFPEETLTTIPGVGRLTAAVILAEVGDIKRFPSAKRFVGYCGLYPRVYQSGKLEVRSRMTHKGNRMLKMAFLLASASARQHNPQIAVYYERLRQRGKSKKACGGAIARKLAEIVYAILNKGEPWDAEKAREGIILGQKMAGETKGEGAAWPTVPSGNKFRQDDSTDRGSCPLDSLSSSLSGSQKIIPPPEEVSQRHHLIP